MSATSGVSSLFSTTRFNLISKIGRRVGGYGSSIILSSLVNLAVVPIVISFAGSSAWGGIAVAQSIASLGFVLVAFGWGVTGPSAVAGREFHLRGQFFVDSVIARTCLFVVVGPMVLLLVWLLAPGNAVANIFVALAALLPALGSSWFFVGERRPWRLLFMENIPRAIGTAAGASILIATGNIVWFAALQSVGALLAIILAGCDVARRHPGFRLTVSLKSVSNGLRSQASGMVAASTAALYVNLPLVLIAAFVPQATAVYALADKLLKFSLAAYSPIVQVAQGYVPNRNAEVHRARAKLALRLSLIVGAIGGGCYITIAPWAAGVLSAGVLVVPLAVTVPLGIAFASIAVSAVVGLACLTAFGAIRKVAISTIIGVLFGVPLTVLGGLFFGLVGIAWGMAISELIVAVYQVLQLRAFTVGPNVLN